MKFSYSPRPGVGKESNGINVLINKQKVATITESGLDLSQTDFKEYEITWKVPADVYKALISFEAFGDSDGVGG